MGHWDQRGIAWRQALVAAVAAVTLVASGCKHYCTDDFRKAQKRGYRLIWGQTDPGVETTWSPGISYPDLKLGRIASAGARSLSGFRGVHGNFGGGSGGGALLIVLLIALGVILVPVVIALLVAVVVAVVVGIAWLGAWAAVLVYDGVAPTYGVCDGRCCAEQHLKGESAACRCSDQCPCWRGKLYQ